LDGETVWLTQAQMAKLFQTTKQNISLHTNNAFKEGELDPDSTVKEYLTVATEKPGISTVMSPLETELLSVTSPNRSYILIPMCKNG
jgi:hypothetical protein